MSAGSVRLSADGRLGRVLPRTYNAHTVPKQSADTRSSVLGRKEKRPASMLEKRFSIFDSMLYESIDPGDCDAANSHLIRIFMKDETYRTVKFPETWYCEQVIEQLWTKVVLPGRQTDYKFYIVYKKEGARFADNRELAVNLLGTELLEVEKVYLRHKDEKAGHKRLASKRRDTAPAVVLKDGSRDGGTSWYETLRTSHDPQSSNQAGAGGHHRISRVQSGQQTQLAKAFSNAWEEGTRVLERQEAAQHSPSTLQPRVQHMDSIDETCDQPPPLPPRPSHMEPDQWPAPSSPGKLPSPAPSLLLPSAPLTSHSPTLLAPAIQYRFPSPPPPQHTPPSNRKLPSLSVPAFPSSPAKLPPPSLPAPPSNNDLNIDLTECDLEDVLTIVDTFAKTETSSAPPTPPPPPKSLLPGSSPAPHLSLPPPASFLLKCDHLS